MVSLPCIIWALLWRSEHEIINIKTPLKEKSFWNWSDIRGSRTKSTFTPCYLPQTELRKMTHVGPMGLRKGNGLISQGSLLQTFLKLLCLQKMCPWHMVTTFDELIVRCLGGIPYPHLELSCLLYLSTLTWTYTISSAFTVTSKKETPSHLSLYPQYLHTT